MRPRHLESNRASSVSKADEKFIPLEQSIPPRNFTKQPSIPVRKGGEKPRACELRCGLPNGRQGRAAAPVSNRWATQTQNMCGPKNNACGDNAKQNPRGRQQNETRNGTCKILTPSAAMDRNQERWLATNTSVDGQTHAAQSEDTSSAGPGGSGVWGSERLDSESPELTRGRLQTHPAGGQAGYLLFGSSGRTGRSFPFLFFLFKLSLMLL